MNSSIELRGWIKDKEQREYLEYGMCYKFDFIGFPLDKKHECRDHKGNEFGCDELIWMLFTGIKDKRGKKVFEGDIVSKEGAYIVYDSGLSCFCFQFKGSKTPPVPLFHNHKPFAVLGNIYENSDLL